MRLEDRVVLMPAAGGGMGTAVARLFAREGARLVLTARREEPLQALAELARADGGQAVVCAADATTEAGCDAMVATAVREFGRVDALYCNLGEYDYGDLELHETPPDAWDYLLDLNLRGHYLCARASLAQMLRQRPAGGALVHVAASADVLRTANQGYAAAKAGLLAFVRRTARQYRDRNIRVNALCPGSIGGTPPPAEPIGVPPGEIARPAQSLDVAYAALYLASDESGWVTGQVLEIDGGAALG